MRSTEQTRILISFHVFSTNCTAAVAIDVGANIAFVRCRFTNNSALFGTVVLISNSQWPVLVVDTIFNDNKVVMDSGGAIILQQSQLILVIFYKNNHVICWNAFFSVPGLKISSLSVQ